MPEENGYTVCTVASDLNPEVRVLKNGVFVTIPYCSRTVIGSSKISGHSRANIIDLPGPILPCFAIQVKPPRKCAG